jgi:hypothetical protein
MIAGLAFVGACAPVRVSSHVAHDLDFSKYHTFAWGAADAFPAGDPRLDRDPFFVDHLEGAVEKQLVRKGLARADARPDLLFHYHAVINRRMDVDQIDREHGYLRADPAGVFEYESGTLVIDVVDARTDRVVWRGWAEHSVDDILASRDRMASTIDQTVERVMARFPGGR